jgi:hypothetical protein
MGRRHVVARDSAAHFSRSILFDRALLCDFAVDCDGALF